MQQKKKKQSASQAEAKVGEDKHRKPTTSEQEGQPTATQRQAEAIAEPSSELPTSELPSSELPSEDFPSTSDHEGDVQDDNGSKKSNKSKKKVLSTEKLKKLKEEYNRRGVVYISRIPPHMKPAKLKQLLAQYAEVNRVYCSLEDPSLRRMRKQKGGNTGNGPGRQHASNSCPWVMDDRSCTACTQPWQCAWITSYAENDILFESLDWMHTVEHGT